MAEHVYSATGARLRARLDAERRQLAGDLVHRIARLREDESRVITVQDADDGDPWDLDLRVLELASVKLRQLEQAIARIDEGGYGRCGQCGAEIGAARLAAMPFAVLCRPCAAAGERLPAHEREGQRAPRPRFATADTEM